MFEKGELSSKGDLHRDAFKKELNLSALLLESPKDVSIVQKYLQRKKLIMSIPRIKHLIKINGMYLKKIQIYLNVCDLFCLLIDKCAILLADSSTSSLSNEDRAEIADLCKNGGFEIVPHKISLSYDYFSKDEVLRAVFPKDIEAPSAFETIGHILHLNLGDAQIPYKHIVGQVLLDKVPRTRTVVNKTGLIQNEFRVFPMEVIAGDNDMIVEGIFNYLIDSTYLIYLPAYFDDSS